MEDRTINIIMLSKRSGNFRNVKKAIAQKCDYISFFREIIEADCDTMLDRMLLAMGMIQVAEEVNGEFRYINGWHDTDFTKKLDANKWVIK